MDQQIGLLSHAVVKGMEVKGLPGLPSPTQQLFSSDGKIGVIVASAEFPWLEATDQVVVSITITKVAPAPMQVEPELRGPGLIIPGKAN